MSTVKTQLVVEGVNNTKKTFDQVESQLGTLSTSAKRAGAALLAAFSVSSVMGFVRESTRATAEMARMAQLSGTTTQQFQKFAHAARSVGFEQDKLGDVFKDVQDKIGDFLQTGGGELADFFENIAPMAGVTAEQFRNLSGPDALQLYVSSLEKANLSHSEMTFYLEAIANDAALLLPLLQNNGAAYEQLAKQAEELGLVLSDSTVKQAEQFNRSMRTLGAVSEGTGNQISAELLPTMNELTGLMVDVSTKSGYAAQIANVLGFGMKTLASAVMIAGNSFGFLGRFIAGAAAAATQALQGNFKEAADIMRMVGEDNVRETGLAMDRIKKLWTGAYEAQGKAANEVQAQWAASQSGMSQSTRLTAAEVKAQYEGIAKEAKKQIAEITKAEREANSESERLRNERLEIEKRYAQASAEIQSGGRNAKSSYSNAQDLQARARQSLKSGDYEQAKTEAAGALKMLRDMAAAGENTYGLQGFADQLKAIELEANRLQQTEADQKLQTLAAQLDDLKQKADIKITVDMPDAQLQAVTKKIQALATALSQTLVITPTIDTSAIGGGSSSSQVYQSGSSFSQFPAFATGGRVRGRGTGTSDSILARLSNGEYVIRADAVRRIGVNALDMINKGMPMPGFADGGLVETAMAMPGAQPGRDLGKVELHVGGQPIVLYGDGSSMAEINRRNALKFGRPGR